MSEDTSLNVNRHYLDHVVQTGASHDVAVTEDIMTAGGIKLLAKGGRIDARARERLLEHKLSKPLESCLEVAGGVAAVDLESVGEALLNKHTMLAVLCASPQGRSVCQSLGALRLSPPMSSLLTVFSNMRPGRLEHATGAAMLALALARRVFPGDIERHRVLATAGLLHDVGELYIDPARFTSSSPVADAHWRHVAAHPLVGSRVLSRMEGMPPGVAEAVLLHHERLNGFGYPDAVRGDAFTMDGQIIAAAEWLMAVLEHHALPLERARMATRLLLGEFDPLLMQAIATMASSAQGQTLEPEGTPDAMAALPRVLEVSATLERFHEERGWIEERIVDASPPLADVLVAARDRLLRIQVAFSSAGLDAQHPAVMLGEVTALNDPAAYAEVTTLVDELGWRLRELKRQQGLRAHRLDAGDRRVVGELLGRVFRDGPAPEA